MTPSSRRRFLAGALAASLALCVSPTLAAEPQKITVIGGTGMIGQRIVQEALQRGHEVTLIARDPAKVTHEH
ncbi:MAG: NAD(P)H-binding protein, partial [Gammaproteobacteria bacterium]|nr:NAD(P)H-binding protein [Gammaproteobacteria bacterium]